MSNLQYQISYVCMDGCMYVYIQVFVLLLLGQEYTCILYNKSCSIFIYLFIYHNLWLTIVIKGREIQKPRDEMQ